MHQFNVLILGPASFLSTLNELRQFLKFNPIDVTSKLDFEVILFHEDAFRDENSKNIINNNNCLKVYAHHTKKLYDNFDAYLELPSSAKEIDTIIEGKLAADRAQQQADKQEWLEKRRPIDTLVESEKPVARKSMDGN